ncbi:DUF502 domain-containing protein [Zoogloea sp.]|uniref:DUF502 domain-containing protein n=1 Tax=Zoogloea sp. TaxID=49181 RepID=UPI0035B3932D|nr:DUF502 domain-containing protein [Rhodocyclales bacterium]
MKKYFVTGLLIWTPLVITFMVLAWIVNTLDQVLLLVPAHFRPEALFGFPVPGVGVLISVALLLITGLAAANFVGQRLVGFWEALLARIPVVKSIYSSVKQVSDTLLSSNGQAFRKALLIQYPRQGMWTIGFQTGTPNCDVAQHLPGDHVSVYVPTTPNPTSGFFLILPKEDTVELEMSVDEALKYIISMGVVAPPADCPQTTTP